VITIGVDVGKKGAAAILSEKGKILDIIEFSKHTEPEIAHLLNKSFLNNIEDYFAYIEKVHSSPQMGVTSSFSFGKSFGFIIGCLTALQIPFEFVTPQKWQKSLGCLSKGDKNITKQKAQQLFPNSPVTITHNIADALLIAEFGRKERLGKDK